MTPQVASKRMQCAVFVFLSFRALLFRPQNYTPPLKWGVILLFTFWFFIRFFAQNQGSAVFALPWFWGFLRLILSFNVFFQ